MPDPVPLGDAIRALMEAEEAVYMHGLNEETRSAFADAWSAALDAARRRGGEQPAGLSPDVAEAVWEAAQAPADGGRRFAASCPGWHHIGYGGPHHEDDCPPGCTIAHPTADAIQIGFDTMPFESESIHHKAPTTLDSINDLYAQMGETQERLSHRVAAVCGRQEVLDWFADQLPRTELMPGALAGSAALFSVPLRVDDDVPASTIRLVHGDGTTKDTRVRMNDERPVKPKRRRFSLRRWCARK